MTKKRLKQVIRTARWRTSKRTQLAHGWVETYMNTLVPVSYGDPVVPQRGWTPMKTPAPCVGCVAYTHGQTR